MSITLFRNILAYQYVFNTIQEEIYYEKIIQIQSPVIPTPLLNATIA